MVGLTELESVTSTVSR